jgi:phosphate acetyltransferase
MRIILKKNRNVSTFEKFVDVDDLSTKLSAFEAEGMTQKCFNIIC